MANALRFILLACLCLPIGSPGQAPRAQAPVNAFLEAKVKAAAALAAPATREELDRRRALQKRELLRSLGLDPLPPRTPLNARVTGVIDRPGYRIEKIVFDSRPGFPVTAHLYVPAGAPQRGGLPVIINPHGHWGFKKNEPTVQARLIGQARRGYLALVVDSPGFSFEGTKRIERRWAGTHDDLRLVLGAQTATGVYVWDLIRALDYLETRPEADMSRVGITGASGGGLATLWAFAAEPRFACAAPVVFASSLEVNPNNGCLCNHVPGTVRLGDRADVLALRAPAPVLIIGAEGDPEFPAAGMRLSGEKLRRLWGLFGRADDAWLRMFPGGHDYSRPMRETALGFFDKYLRGVGDGSPVPEPELRTEPPDAEEMFVLSDPPPGARTMRDIARSMFEGRAASGTAAEYIALNGGLPKAVPPRMTRKASEGPVTRFTFASETGLTVPALSRQAERPSGTVAVFVSDDGMASAFAGFEIDGLVAQGISCLALDPRGLGELAGLELRYTTYLGQAPAFGMGWDIVRAVAAWAGGARRVAVVGRGPAAGQAALAAALMEPRIGFVAGLGTLREFGDAFRDDVPLLAVQPRAVYAPPLSRLRALVRADAVWSYLGEPEPDWTADLLRWAKGAPADQLFR